MAVSVVSTVPSFLPLPPATASLNAPKNIPFFLTKLSAIAYIGNKIEADAASEDRFHRRDILKCVGATICVELIRSSGTFVQGAEAAGLMQRRQLLNFFASSSNEAQR